MPDVRTTVVVVPRETLSRTLETLAVLFANTPRPHRVVVVDGGSSRRQVRRLERLAVAHDFTLIHSDCVLSPNEARNLGMQHVDTEYVAFLDNDALVDAGWLRALERCADETHAAAVTPVLVAGRGDDWEIHYAAGGICRIESDVVGRRCTERNPHIHRPVADVAGFTRTRTQHVELHCILARADTLRRIGPFDEGLVRSWTDARGREMQVAALYPTSPDRAERQRSRHGRAIERLVARRAARVQVAIDDVLLTCCASSPTPAGAP